MVSTAQSQSPPPILPSAGRKAISSPAGCIFVAGVLTLTTPLGLILRISCFILLPLRLLP